MPEMHPRPKAGEWLSSQMGWMVQNWDGGTSCIYAMGWMGQNLEWSLDRRSDGNDDSRSERPYKGARKKGAMEHVNITEASIIGHNHTTVAAQTQGGRVVIFSNGMDGAELGWWNALHLRHGMDGAEFGMVAQLTVDLNDRTKAQVSEKGCYGTAELRFAAPESNVSRSQLVRGPVP
ncbi:hypothetical protein M405DRAFT_564754 [Rhizopogon salebrosus TDB-379]|nr:hypothetical protein M405DRAFT_564754 [Rhizopogon salebrosus TDB-379]